MLILFVLMFSVILALAAFAIDQGFWFGRRRIAQHAADASARAGAIAFLGEAGPVPEPCDDAALAALQNQMDAADIVSCDDSERVGGVNECLRSVLERHAPSLFSGLFGVTGIDVGAQAVACAGTALDVRITDDDRGPEGIPILLARSTGPGQAKDCFAPGNHLDPGVECVIWGSMEDNNANRLVWFEDSDPSNQACDDDIGINAAQTRSKIEGGVSWSCESDSYAIAGEYVVPVANIGFDQQDMRQGIQDRLARVTTCEGPDDQSFQAAFGKGDGALGAAEPPPPFDPGGPLDRIYVRNNCFNNPRIAVVPFTNESATTTGAKVIEGFAVIYITGCYLSDEPLHANGESITETDECEDWPSANADDQDTTKNCTASGTYVPSEFCKYEVRGVPVRVFLAEAGVGRLGDMTDTDGNDFPLTIQTME